MNYIELGPWKRTFTDGFSVVSGNRFGVLEHLITSTRDIVARSRGRTPGTGSFLPQTSSNDVTRDGYLRVGNLSASYRPISRTLIGFNHSVSWLWIYRMQGRIHKGRLNSELWLCHLCCRRLSVGYSDSAAQRLDSRALCENLISGKTLAMHKVDWQCRTELIEFLMSSVDVPLAQRSRDSLDHREFALRRLAKSLHHREAIPENYITITREFSFSLIFRW